MLCLLTHKASMELQSGRQILIALKAITLPNEEEKLKKSKNEVRMITRLPKHPNLVRYLGSAVLRRHAFIGMELCDGTLDRYIKSPRLYKDRTAQDRSVTRWGMIEQISLGLTIAHRRGIIHRDIKLENSNPRSYRSCLTYSPVYSRPTQRKNCLENWRLRYCVRPETWGTGQRTKRSRSLYGAGGPGPKGLRYSSGYV